jgi:hypothetical protein
MGAHNPGMRPISTGHLGGDFACGILKCNFSAT